MALALIPTQPRATNRHPGLTFGKLVRAHDNQIESDFANGSSHKLTWSALVVFNFHDLLQGKTQSPRLRPSLHAKR